MCTENEERNRELTKDLTSGRIDSQTYLRERKASNPADKHPIRTYMFDSFKAFVSDISSKTNQSASNSK